ncbi:achaete-scute homolog 4-like [Stegostoma tigrinum]|uniref:achaete-scute homolog 4-like n=1 Tax=Stegostoma tigrinum TaxID=3053191 RepID=UPI00202B34C7|nr:achaete-scute homolog 4-like [Stegostoma tigrinum]XP_048405342.1 achaete-scute homolog 4-like [Stegostoma tigrinum]
MDDNQRGSTLERIPYPRPIGVPMARVHECLGMTFAEGLPLSFPVDSAYLDGTYHEGYVRRLSYLPFHSHLGIYDYSFEPAFIRKRNERERQRVRYVNEGYARLREHLPDDFADKRLSKVETLRAAINYIKHLQELLNPSEIKERRSQSPRAVEVHKLPCPDQRRDGNSDGESKSSSPFSELGELSS